MGLRLGFQKAAVDTLIDEIKEDFEIKYEELHAHVLDLPHPNKN